MADAGLEALIAAAAGKPRALAALAMTLAAMGRDAEARALARSAVSQAPEDGEVRARAAALLSRDVPSWHFGIVNDHARNAAYDAALRRAVGPGTRVLDIGAGTGLLAMMAARAGAAAVTACEMNPAVAEAARAVVAANGLADRVRIVPKRSTDLDVEADLGGPVDLIVSEIVSNRMLAEDVLPVMEEAARRLLKPGGRMIPAAGTVRAALAWHPDAERRRMGEVAGFDLSAFNELSGPWRTYPVGDPDLAIRSAPADVLHFDFQAGGPWPEGRAAAEATADGGPVNGVVQWIRLHLDETGVYENRPGPGAQSCWAAAFYPLAGPAETAAGDPWSIGALHDRHNLWLWAGPRNSA